MLLDIHIKVHIFINCFKVLIYSFPANFEGPWLYFPVEEINELRSVVCSSMGLRKTRVNLML
jgi:hypothetical protein